MTRKTIAVDIDDVLAINVPAVIDFSNKKWGTKLTLDDWHENWAEMWKIEVSETFKRAKAMDKANLWAAHKKIEKADQVLHDLKKKFKLVIATSRRKELETVTLEWIDSYFPDVFEEVHYSGIFEKDKLYKDSHKATKGELVRQIGADYLIDDHTKHCFAAAEGGISSLLFGDYPWTRKNNLPDRVTWVKDWPAVAEYFNV